MLKLIVDWNRNPEKMFTFSYKRIYRKKYKRNIDHQIENKNKRTEKRLQSRNRLGTDLLFKECLIQCPKKHGFLRTLHLLLRLLKILEVALTNNHSSQIITLTD